MFLKELLEIISLVSYEALNVEDRVAGFSIDTRTLKPGDVFVALQGERFHGNEFAAQALDQGAVAILTDQPLSKGIPHILVKDALKALTEVAEYKRLHFKGTVVGVTGTAGKTSVKEAMAFILSEMGLNVHASQKSYNNHIGVPLTVANLPEGAEVLIAEMGMNSPGEILEHTQLCRPHVAVVTSVGPGHIEFFNSVEEIALEKVSIGRGVVSGGGIVLPRDSEYYELMNSVSKDEYKVSSTSFGRDSSATYGVLSSEVVDEDFIAIGASLNGKGIEYRLPTRNAAWINNSLGILAVIDKLGLNAEIAAGYFQNLTLASGRGVVHKVVCQGKAITLIDDAYNANPLSVDAALRTLAQYSGRKIAVLGDMRELGQHSKEYHEQIGKLCRELKIDKVIACGLEMKAAYEQLSSDQQVAHVLDRSEISGVLLDMLQDGDVVLLKASNGVRLFEVVRQLEEGLLEGR